MPNRSVIEAKTRTGGKDDLMKTDVDYIYVVRYEDYREVVPFSPGDLRVEEIYSNANSQIWRVKK